MKNILVLLFALQSIIARAEPFTDADVYHFQPPIVVNEAPSRPLNTYNLWNNTVKVGLAPMRPIIPSFNGQGKLLASWTPHPNGSTGRPTVIIMHGGHGLNPTNFETGMWARDQLGANVLILDSYWSRGVQENWIVVNNMGANMRMLDAISAGRWLHTQPIDKNKIFIIGDSQGGWAVLRTFTDDRWISKQTQGLFRGGISLYPVCDYRKTPYHPTLGPYTAPVLILTGGKDTATPPDKCPSNVFTDAYNAVNYPNATHSWDVANNGAYYPPTDGACSKAMNPHYPFSICRSNAVTEDARARIKQFVFNLI